MKKKPNDSTKNEYLSSELWARVLATAWIEKDFLDAFEYSPLKAVKERFPVDEYPEFDFEKILYLPENPNYTTEELERAVRGDIVIVPRSGIFSRG